MFLHQVILTPGSSTIFAANRSLVVGVYFSGNVLNIKTRSHKQLQKRQMPEYIEVIKLDVIFEDYKMKTG